jgi:thiamine biosynthesis lipoprotein
VLDWGAQAARLTGGIVDIAMLDARLAAEAMAPSGGAMAQAEVEDAPAEAMPPAEAVAQAEVEDAPSGGAMLSEPVARPDWSLIRFAGRPSVARPAGLRFDLDGVAKGWIADRALALLWRHPGAIVDADGDLAIRVAPGDAWEIGVADPTTPGFDLAVLRLRGSDSTPSCFGLATSGVSVHRWVSARGVGHHLIDPRTGSPADTDVVQATVLASSAREAELLAKTAVILGSVGGLDFLDRSGALGAVILTNRDERLALPRTLRWLA